MKCPNCGIEVETRLLPTRPGGEPVEPTIFEAGGGVHDALRCLRKQLDSMTHQLATAQKSYAFHVQACGAHQAHIDELHSRLAAAQAIIGRMRDALTKLMDLAETVNSNNVVRKSDAMVRVIEAALAAKGDPQ